MSESESRREAQVRALFDGFGGGPEAVRAAIREVFADDCVWSNPGMPTTTGPEQAIGLVAQFEQGFGVFTTEFEISHLAVRGDVVLVERVDHARREDGSLIVDIPVVGVLEFAGDRLVAWREFFDSAVFATVTT